MGSFSLQVLYCEKWSTGTYNAGGVVGVGMGVRLSAGGLSGRNDKHLGC